MWNYNGNIEIQNIFYEDPQIDPNSIQVVYSWSDNKCTVFCPTPIDSIFSNSLVFVMDTESLNKTDDDIFNFVDMELKKLGFIWEE